MKSCELLSIILLYTALNRHPSEIEKLKEETPSRDASLPAEVQPTKPELRPQSQAPSTKAQNFKPAKSRSRPATSKPREKDPANEDWELDCEVCGAKGVNKVMYFTCEPTPA